MTKVVTQTIESERKQQSGQFLGMLLGSLGGNLLGNILAGKGVSRVSNESHCSSTSSFD